MEERPGGTPLASRLAQGALTLVILYLVFGRLLPGLVDWSEVGDALADVSVGWLVVVGAIALALELVKAREQALLIPILGLQRALVALEVTAVASNLVPGPSGTAARFMVYRSWGVDSAQFAKGWIVSSAFNNLMVLLLPVAGAICVVVASDVDLRPLTAGLALAAAVVAIAAAALGVAILRSERIAARVGRLAGAAVRRLRGLLKRPSGADAEAAVLRFRADALEALRAVGLPLGLTIFGKFALTAFLLWLALRAVGVPGGALNPAEVLAAYAFVRLGTIVDITPGSVGIAEALYAASLSFLAAGRADEDVIMAGVIVFRAATYALPIVLGALSYVVWRMRRDWRAPVVALPAADDVVAAAAGHPLPPRPPDA